MKNNIASINKSIRQNAKICIWGSNRIAGKIYDELKQHRPDTEVKFFIDSSISGKLHGLPVYSPKELILHLKEVDTAISASFSARYYLEVLLSGLGIESVIVPDKKFYYELAQKERCVRDVNKTAKVFKTAKDRKLFKFLAKARTNVLKYTPALKKYYDKFYTERYNGKVPLDHYFEFVKFDKIKNVIDGGGFDGFSALTFVRNFPHLEKVFVFEPCYDDFKDILIDEIIKKDDRIEIIYKGLWDADTVLEFREETRVAEGSAIVAVRPDNKRPHKIIEINTVSIDSFVKEQNVKIDFIKLDVENAEMKVLEGAKNTLIKDRPQLAISIYHSDEHFYNIPLLLNEWLENYEFRLGHYTGTVWDTVLYAIPEELLK